MWKSKPVTSVSEETRTQDIRYYSLFHIRQKEKIEMEFVVKIASVNRPQNVLPTIFS